MGGSDVYRYPRYYALGYRWNTDAECDFLEACLTQLGPPEAKRLLDLGCGSGRHMAALARRGYALTGIDITPEMVRYVNDEARRSNLTMTALEGDLRRLSLLGVYDAAFCLMDTFRFLLTNEDILTHLRTVAAHLTAGGLYVTDFWVPSQWDLIGREVHQWEQTEGETTVRVFYLQHPETIDPIAQTFEDELVFEVHEDGTTKEIRGGRTRTRLLMPQEFGALIDASEVFELLATRRDFSLSRPTKPDARSWRMISVLRKR